MLVQLLAHLIHPFFHLAEGLFEFAVWINLVLGATGFRTDRILVLWVVGEVLLHMHILNGALFHDLLYWFEHGSGGGGSAAARTVQFDGLTGRHRWHYRHLLACEVDTLLLRGLHHDSFN